VSYGEGNPENGTLDGLYRDRQPVGGSVEDAMRPVMTGQCVFRLHRVHLSAAASMAVTEWF
jgi:hypothetical protein